MTSRSLTALRRSLASLLAIVALLAQTLVPHVHGRVDRLAAPSAGLVTCDATDCATLAPSTPVADEHGHHAAGCPLCRAQSDARSLVLPLSVVVALPVAAASAFAGDAVIAVAAVSRSLAAPRAPPAVS